MAASAKLLLLDRLLRKMKPRGDRVLLSRGEPRPVTCVSSTHPAARLAQVLLFCQSTQMLDVLQVPPSAAAAIVIVIVVVVLIMITVLIAGLPPPPPLELRATRRLRARRGAVGGGGKFPRHSLDTSQTLPRSGGRRWQASSGSREEEEAAAAAAAAASRSRLSSCSRPEQVCGRGFGLFRGRGTRPREGRVHETRPPLARRAGPQPHRRQRRPLLRPRLEPAGRLASHRPGVPRRRREACHRQAAHRSSFEQVHRLGQTRGSV